ncbi:MAG: RluA family pseudouridine synthase [Desulfofustis sp.]
MDMPQINEASFSCAVEQRFHNLRLDQYLALQFEEYSRSQIGQAIKAGNIRVNTAEVKPGHRLKTGDTIDGSLGLDRQDSTIEPEDIYFQVLLEDPDFIVIAKPPGLVVHPGSGNRDNTLVNGLLYRYGELAEVGDNSRPGIVHRLDKETSGVMVVARTKRGHAALVDQFKYRRVEKTYLAIVRGVIPEPCGRIVAPLGRHPINRQKMAVRLETGRYAASSWKCRASYRTHTLLEVQIETGRTHQIRVHMAHIGHPVVGDKLYGRASGGTYFPRHMLHAWKLRFFHPRTGERVSVVADPGDDFNAAIDRLEAL